MVQNTYVKDLYEEYEAVKLRIAFAEMEAECGEDEPKSEYSDLAQAKLVALIDQKLKKIRRKKFWQRVIPKACRVTAMVLLACYLSLTVAIAASSTVRVAIFEFILQTEDEYTQVWMVDDKTKYIKVPAEWKGFYYPSYIPEGYELYEVDPTFIEVYYLDDQNNRLCFMEGTDGDSVLFDTEDAGMEYIDLHGTEALLSQKGRWTTVVWSIDNRFFLLELENCEKEIAIEIARSVRMIK